MDAKTLVHTIGLLVAGTVLAAGVVLLFTAGLANSVPLNLIGADIAALLAVLLAVWVLRTRYRASPNWTIVPAIESTLRTPTPGTDIDDLIYKLTALREGTIEYRDRIHDRISEIAVAVLMGRQNISEEQAAAQIEDGSWADSDLAASFFRTKGKGSKSSVVDRVKRRLTGGQTMYERQVLETVREIESVSGFFDDDQQPETDEANLDRGMSPVGLDDGDDDQQITETVRYRSLIETHHWTGITAFAFLALSLGILSSQPPVILASALGMGVAGYSRMTSAPELANLDVTRVVSDETPEPGDEIEVTVTVENAGDSFLSDLRLIDRVPSTMQVVDGSARLGTALSAGDTASFTYRLVVDRGDHSWPVQVIARGLSSSVEREAFVDADTEISCVPRLKTVADMPVRMQTSMFPGGVQTKTGGEGLEFHSIRDYQPGDPQSRIDWKSFARTGEFSTIDFRKEHAARVVLMFDARDSSYVSREPGEKHALNTSVDAAYDVFASLYDQGHLIGIAAFNGISCWLGPSTGTMHLQRVRHLFSEHPALSTLPPAYADKEEGRYVDPMTHIRRQLPSNSQIFLFSPLTDHYTYEVARRLNGAGHLVTIISPDPTAARTVGQRIARLERIVRINQLRDYGIRIIDWDTDRPLDLELEFARRRWQA